jgi:hypothetical protein
MKAIQLARRMGLGRNPLRRRTDKIAACLGMLLAVVFLAGAPLLSAATAGWAGRAAAVDQRTARSWHQVPAKLLSSAPVAGSVDGFGGAYTWGTARWTAPDGRMRTGQITVNAAVSAGQLVPLWVDRAGWPTGPPPSRETILAREAIAAIAAALALGTLLLCLAAVSRRILDRRRLENWEAAWITVGPEWTQRFRSRGQP